MNCDRVKRWSSRRLPAGIGQLRRRIGPQGAGHRQGLVGGCRARFRSADRQRSSPTRAPPRARPRSRSPTTCASPALPTEPRVSACTARTGAFPGSIPASAANSFASCRSPSSAESASAAQDETLLVVCYRTTEPGRLRIRARPDGAVGDAGHGSAWRHDDALEGHAAAALRAIPAEDGPAAVCRQRRGLSANGL